MRGKTFLLCILLSGLWITILFAIKKSQKLTFLMLMLKVIFLLCSELWQQYCYNFFFLLFFLIFFLPFQFFFFFLIRWLFSTELTLILRSIFLFLLKTPHIMQSFPLLLLLPPSRAFSTSSRWWRFSLSSLSWMKKLSLQFYFAINNARSFAFSV